MNTPTASPTLSRITRRRLLARGAMGLAASALPAMAAEQAKGETLVQQLHSSLTEPQRAALCFKFDHALRLKVDNNWHVTKPSIGQILTRDQQDLTKQIFRSLHSEEYVDEVWRQLSEDNGKGGFESTSIAMFGQPGTGKFEFVLTGRHCTRRCDGDSETGAAFGGPIFYGHASRSFNEGPKHEGNAYWYQAKRANAVYQALSGAQREVALLDEGRDEEGNDTVKLTGKTKGLPGIALRDLSADQQGLVKDVLGDLLKPFRKIDADEAMRCIEGAGLDSLHMAFYKKEDIGNDGVWDVWQIEGPKMVWYFRGVPHVHCWAHIRA
jgi:Protein of unknown function (DUF3500)